eukprot:395333_1
MFRAVNDTSDTEITDDEGYLDYSNPRFYYHALDSPSLCVRIFHYITHFWVFSLIKKLKVDAEYTTKLPKSNKTKHAYNKWMKIYHHRKQHNLSTSTASMIYQTEKQCIIFSLCVAVLILILLFMGY